jgi:ribosomal protein S27AE
MPSDNIEGSQSSRHAREIDLEDDLDVHQRRMSCKLHAESTHEFSTKELGVSVEDDFSSKSQVKDGVELPFRTNPRRLEDSYFVHEPLQLNIPSIRLITVLPSDGDNEIRCTVTHVTLEVPPSYDPFLWPSIAAQYTCLSYVWGSPDQTRWIKVNGKSFEVQINLWNFLRNVCSAKATGEYTNKWWCRSLWIDAICIDQENNLERNHQVQQMGRIYSRATQVVAWLGDDARLAALIRSRQPVPILLKEYGITRFTGSRTLTLQESETLCNNTYWKRAWVVQEVLHARQLLLLAGGAMMDVETCKDMLLNAQKSEAQEPLDLLENVAGKHSNALITNIEIFRRKDCHNIRDRVYSLLSISCDGSQLPVKYDSSLGELARSVIRINKDGVCFESVLLVIQSISLEQSLLDVDACLPIIATRGFQMLRYKTTCPRCGEDISMTQHKVAVSDPSRSRYMCLHCNHFGSLRPSGVHEISHHGHLCVIWGAIDEVDSCDWHLFWAPLDRSEWHRLRGYKYTLASRNGGLRRLIISLGLLCEIESLISRHQQQDPMHFLSRKTNHYPACTSSWEVVE